MAAADMLDSSTYKWQHTKLCDAPRLRRARRQRVRESRCSLYTGLLRLGRRSPSCTGSPAPASPLPPLNRSASAARAAALSCSASAASAVGCSMSGDSRSYVCLRLLKPLVPASSEPRGEMRSPCCTQRREREGAERRQPQIDTAVVQVVCMGQPVCLQRGAQVRPKQVMLEPNV